MSKTLNFAKLDYITISPYLTFKNIFIFLILTFFMAFASGIVTAISMFAAIGTLYVSYPFAIGDKSGMDILYSTLPINKKTVVLGRYLFSLSINIFTAVITIIIAFVVLFFDKTSFTMLEIVVTALISLLFFTLVEFIQLPIYFKLGYAKAKIVSLSVLFAIPLLVVIATTFKNEQIINLADNLFIWITNNILLTTIITLFLWIIFFFISINISVKFYKRREF